MALLFYAMLCCQLSESPISRRHVYHSVVTHQTAHEVVSTGLIYHGRTDETWRASLCVSDVHLEGIDERIRRRTNRRIPLLILSGRHVVVVAAVTVVYALRSFFRHASTYR